MKSALRELLFAAWAVVLAHFIVGICEAMAPAHQLTPGEAGLGILSLALPLFAVIRWAFSVREETGPPADPTECTARQDPPTHPRCRCVSLSIAAADPLAEDELHCPQCGLVRGLVLAMPPRPPKAPSFFLWECASGHGYLRLGRSQYDETYPLVAVEPEEARHVLLA